MTLRHGSEGCQQRGAAVKRGKDRTLRKAVDDNSCRQKNTKMLCTPSDILTSTRHIRPLRSDNDDAAHSDSITGCAASPDTHTATAHAKRNQ
jgi:hypothetical protein